MGGVGVGLDEHLMHYWHGCIFIWEWIFERTPVTGCKIFCDYQHIPKALRKLCYLGCESEFINALFTQYMYIWYTSWFFFKSNNSICICMHTQDQLKPPSMYITILLLSLDAVYWNTLWTTLFCIQLTDCQVVWSHDSCLHTHTHTHFHSVSVQTLLHIQYQYKMLNVWFDWQLAMRQYI